MVSRRLKTLKAKLKDHSNSPSDSVLKKEIKNNSIP